MRLVALLLAVAFASPALADYRAIMTALPGLLKDIYGSADVAKQDEDYVKKYNTYILDGIDGIYIPISLLGQADEPKFRQVCGGPAAVKITRQGNYRFSLVENYQGTTPVEYTYTYRLGNTFTFNTDPDKLFKAHGIPVDDPRAAAVITAELFSSSGFSTVIRTEGMLVFQRNLTKPMIYARCDG